MCGIVGLHLKAPDLYPRLGALLVPMLESMSSRGPDSAGIALYDGQGMEIVKDVGAPADICAEHGIARRGGFQGIGHTRMATESAVTTEHSHPFAPLPDMAVVHNGSFSNHATVRRRLERDGVRCVTDNDTEVAARFIGHRMAGGGSGGGSGGTDLADALRMVRKELDGFFTLLVTTGSQFAVMRDSFACKPAVIAETARYVAVASEYHALAGLPGIGEARVFEPVPEEVYVWTR
jgi:methylamine---glutamate N-methyltransferase subunit A